MGANLDMYVAGITEHAQACNCERCEGARAEAMRAHGWLVSCIMFGAEPAKLCGAIASVDVELERAVRPTEPWSGDDDIGTKALTRREIRVAELICSGMVRTEVSRMLGMSPRTFDTHRMHVMHKMRVANEVQLLRMAILHGWARL